MSYNIRKNWLSSLEIIRERPALLLPFIFIAFFEALALELIYFSPQKPLLIIAGPIVKKFFGEAYLHYPGNFVLLPKLFYYAQLAIYIFIGVSLMSISVNIFKNIKGGLPLKPRALIKNALARYLAFVTLGIVMVGLIVLLKKADTFLINKSAALLSRHIPNLAPRLFSIASPLFMFFTNIVLQALLLLAIPLMVIQRRSLLKALWGSLYLGFRNFLHIFLLICLPFLLYLPVTLLNSASLIIANRTFPGIILLIICLGIFVTPFVDCFVVVCACQFLMDKEAQGKGI